MFKIKIMKKTLLLAAMLFGIQHVTTAQQNISFETSEGYTAGGLNGQNGWLVEADEEGGTGQNNVIVSAAQHSNGTNSLKFVADEEDNAILYDVYKLITSGSTSFSITQDIFVDGVDDENGSELGVVTVDIQGANRLPTSALFFNYTGNISVMSGYDSVEDEFDFTDVGTFENQTWYTVKTTIDLTTRSVKYYVNQTLVYTTSLLNGEAVDAISYVFDDYITSFYVDNIVISNDTAGLSKANAVKFSVFPNPATNKIMVKTNNNALVDNITISDLNGRVVRSTDFEGVTQAQVNIAELSGGMYMMHIVSDKGSITKKIIKQ